MNKNTVPAPSEAGTPDNSVKPAIGINDRLAYAALLLVAALSWLALLLQANSAGMPAGGMTETFTLTGAAGFVAAWTVMMAAMMLPSAAPMLVMYRSIHRNNTRNGQPGISTLTFTLIYLAVWAGLGLPVYAAEQLIKLWASSSASVAGLLPYALALILVAAGVYQFSPLKTVCLRACRSPMAFLLGNWRSGRTGTIRLAIKHALYCTGCCWMLMVVLVAAGSMALHWVLAIAALILTEKLLPYSNWSTRLIGVTLLILGALVALQPELANIMRGQGGMGDGM